jgi:aryl-alcohol dehydrogenase-like predicted oxidoreductase
MPIVGIGTANVFNLEPGDEPWATQEAVLREFVALGGRMLDTAPSYGRAETVLGEMISSLGIRDDLFLATKVRKDGRVEGLAEMNASGDHLRTETFDLLAVHNLVDVETQLATIRERKEAGKVRYVGITTSSDRQYEEFAAVMERETLDFIQVNYSLAARGAAERILPLAAERGIAVVVNVPFGRGRLFTRVGDNPVPEFAQEFGADTWGKFFLKYILSHPAVTCVIPGTDRVEYVQDNVGAGTGDLPDLTTRIRMEGYFDGLAPLPPRPQNE